MNPFFSTGYKLLLVSLTVLFISSCGISRTAVTSEGKEVLSEGIASWSGPNFHGKQTANGEMFNMNDLTAAHRTLPFNTVLLVENLDNGRTVVVRINDRGPYVGNRVIDLSRKAAEEIDMINSGTATVNLYLVDEGDRPVTAQNISSRETFTIQLASFKNEREATNKSTQISGSRVEKVTVAGNVVFRVYYGTFNNIDEARKAYNQLKNRGHNGFVKQIEN